MTTKDAARARLRRIAAEVETDRRRRRLRDLYDEQLAIRARAAILGRDALVASGAARRPRFSVVCVGPCTVLMEERG